MRKTVLGWLALTALLVLLGGSVWRYWQRVVVDFAAAVPAGRPPAIRPDYSGTVIPPNLAATNFLVDEPGTAFGLRIRSTQGAVIEVAGRDPAMVIPLSSWRQLLQSNRGQKLFFDVYVRRRDGTWLQFEPVVNTVANEEIDNYLFYRFIRPIYIIRFNVDIRQRDLRSYEESLVATNRSFRGGCINCHTFAPNHPDRMLLHSRDSDQRSHRSGMIVARKGEVVKVDTRNLVRDTESARGRVPRSLAGYSAWHPNGQLIAFSANDISQFFHEVGENRDVFDAESDLAIYHVESNQVTTTPDISKPDRLETFPAWSPDGRYLYFSSAAPHPVSRYRGRSLRLDADWLRSGLGHLGPGGADPSGQGDRP